MLPDTQVVAGYAPIMPSYQGQIDESDMLALIAYLKSTSAGTRQSPAAGAKSTHEQH
jgi:cytochrome c oxidase subunit 2